MAQRKPLDICVQGSLGASVSRASVSYGLRTKLRGRDSNVLSRLFTLNN